MNPQTGFLHMVYFYGREGGTAEDAQLLAEGCKTHLSNIPGVLRLVVGLPAGTDRPVVDNSYAVALLVEFADAAAHDVYQDHADHHRFIAECKQYWSRVQVYDTLVQADGNRLQGGGVSRHQEVGLQKQGYKRADLTRVRFGCLFCSVDG